MKAAVYTEYGDPSVVRLVDLPKPTPKKNEVLINVFATTVSAGDWRVRSLELPEGMGWMGRLMFGLSKPRKPILGTELSGVVEAVGSAVTQFEPGDAIIAFPGGKMGAHAEYVTMPADGAIVKKPENLSFSEATTLPFGSVTAYDYLVNKAKVQSGETILINGATGSTGAACVQLANHFGAKVTAVCSSANIDLAKSLGAHHVIDYTQADFADGSQHYDIVVDTVGNAPFSRSKQALEPNGRFVMIAGGLSDMIFGPLKARRSGHKFIGGVASEAPEILQKVVDLAEQGFLRPTIDRSYPFEAIVDAHRHVDSRRKKGNVVVELTTAASSKLADAKMYAG